MSDDLHSAVCEILQTVFNYFDAGVVKAESIEWEEKKSVSNFKVRYQNKDVKITMKTRNWKLSIYGKIKGKPKRFETIINEVNDEYILYLDLEKQ
jgi:hypothetical protein